MRLRAWNRNGKLKGKKFGAESRGKNEAEKNATDNTAAEINT